MHIPGNCLWYSRPVYIDIGSICLDKQEIFLATITEFELYFLLPLLLFEKQGFKKTYEFLRLPIPNTEYRKTIAADILDKTFIGGLDFSQPSKKVLKKLIRHIINIQLVKELKTQWSDYDQKEVSWKRPGQFVPKQKAVYDFLLTQPVGHVLDVGCNNGWYSLLAKGWDIRLSH